MLPPDEDWTRRAACEGHYRIFDAASQDNNPGPIRIQRAKAICSTCPVANECLKEGLGIKDGFIWGGLTSEERALSTVQTAESGWVYVRARRHPAGTATDLGPFPDPSEAFRALREFYVLKSQETFGERDAS